MLGIEPVSSVRLWPWYKLLFFFFFFSLFFLREDFADAGGQREFHTFQEILDMDHSLYLVMAMTVQ